MDLVNAGIFFSLLLDTYNSTISLFCLKERYVAPLNFERLLAANLKALTEKGRLIKVINLGNWHKMMQKSLYTFFISMRMHWLHVKDVQYLFHYIVALTSVDHG